MWKLKFTPQFDDWMNGLRDRLGLAAIVTRLSRMERGQFGDAKAIGHGIGEIRIHSGPGYRLYFTRHGDEVILLLCGGDKSSQTRDIEMARDLARQFRQDR